MEVDFYNLVDVILEATATAPTPAKPIYSSKDLTLDKVIIALKGAKPEIQSKIPSLFKPGIASGQGFVNAAAIWKDSMTKPSTSRPIFSHVNADVRNVALLDACFLVLQKPNVPIEEVIGLPEALEFYFSARDMHQYRVTSNNSFLKNAWNNVLNQNKSILESIRQDFMVIQDFTEGDIFDFLDNPEGVETMPNIHAAEGEENTSAGRQQGMVVQRTRGFMKDERKIKNVIYFAAIMKDEYSRSKYNQKISENEGPLGIDAEIIAAEQELTAAHDAFEFGAMDEIQDRINKLTADKEAAIASGEYDKQMQTANSIEYKRKFSSAYKQFLTQNSLLKLHGSDKKAFPRTIKAYVKFCAALGITDKYASDAFTKIAGALSQLGNSMMAAVTR